MLLVQRGDGRKLTKIGNLVIEPRFHKGSGFLSLLSKGIRFLSPLLKKGAVLAKKVVTSQPVKSISKQIGKTAFDMASDTISNVISGNDPKEDIKTNLEKAKKELSESLKTQLKKTSEKLFTKKPEILKRSHDEENILSANNKKRKKIQRKKVAFKTKHSIL